MFTKHFPEKIGTEVVQCFMPNAAKVKEVSIDSHYDRQFLSCMVNTSAIHRLIQQFLTGFLVLVFNPLMLSFVGVLTSVNSVSAATTIVSLTFDDGLTQSAARSMLVSHGMHGTFYINSDYIGFSNYLSKAELDGLFSDGNEIAGHTIGHPNLATLSDAQQVAAICNDMLNLKNWGYSPYSFAYPSAMIGANTVNLLKAGCPGVGVYESARTVNGLKSGSDCSNCPLAESIPPRDPYRIATNGAVIATTTVDEIKSYVTQAENAGGGWVPIVIHRICNGCDTYSVSQTTLEAFLTWLQPRQTLGTYVRTVHQVMSGDIPSQGGGGGDKLPPQINSFEPANGVMVSGNVTLNAQVTDNVAVQAVAFLINGIVVGTDTSSPYSVNWASTAVANGTVTYAIRATDTSGNIVNSPLNQLTVSNVSADTTPPSISFSQPPTPSNNATVSGTVSLAVIANDNVGVARVDFLVNGSVVSSSNSAPYTINLNTTVYANAPATLMARAYDAAGNSAVTSVINVTVNNSTGNGGGNLLTNPSLELDANNDGVADCWQRAGYGTNNYKWTRISSGAHSGNYAESLQITRRSSGDRKLLQVFDSGTCAPAVIPGARYTLSGWYKATVSTGIVVFYRNSSGAWNYWDTSPNFSAASNWIQASYTTPPLPSGATALSFGFYLNKVGTLVTDDYSLLKAP